MELPINFLEQIAPNAGTKKEEQMLIVMDQPTFEKNLSHPLQTNKKRFNIAATSSLVIIVSLMLQSKTINYTSQHQLLMIFSSK